MELYYYFKKIEDVFWAVLNQLDDILWNYICLILIMGMGIFLTIYSRFFQIRALFKFKQHLRDLLNCAEKGKSGTHPIKLYFASIGGMVGLGNIVSVVSVVTIGGPGSILWLWIASLFGMLVKYSEIYLGIKYRVKNNKGGYDGGPMYYLKKAFGSNIMSVIVCVLLCIYGAEVSQFLIITDTVASVFPVDRYLCMAILLLFIFVSSVGGVKRLANICSSIMPLFMVIYIVLGIWVMVENYQVLPSVFKSILDSFLNTKAQITGVLIAAHYGMSRAVYSGDIGIGYDSIIQSETQTLFPEKQARMAIYALFTDSLICTISVMVLLVTGLWKAQGFQPSEYVAQAFALYFPHIQYFMAVLFILAGFTTIIGYLVVGQKCATYLSPKFGRPLYLIYSLFAFIFFSFYDQEQVILIMSVSGGLLMIINLSGLLKLRKDISFS